MSTQPTVFPYMPDGGEEFVESLRYATDILESYSKREQRIAQRGIPGGSIRMSVKALEAVESTEIFGLLNENQAGLWWVPLWPFTLRTSADLAGGESLIPVEPPVAGYGLEVVPWKAHPADSDAAVLLYRSPSEYQVLGFAGLSSEDGWGASWGESWGATTPSATSGVRISTESPAAPLAAYAVQGSTAGWGLSWGNSWGEATASTVAWPAGTLVIPLRRARLDPETASSLLSLEATAGDLNWIIEVPN